jgi:hypothetical protein
MKTLFLKRRLKVITMSLNDAFESPTELPEDSFIPLLIFSSSILLLRAALGSSFGNMLTASANMRRTTAKINQPINQAPTPKNYLLI